MLRRCAFVAAVVLLGFGLVMPAAQAQSPGHFHPRNLVVLGDSFASGVGNIPYDPASHECERSDAAYGPLLQQFHLVNLQAFVACSGATTVNVWHTGQNREPPQINSINNDTDVVTVQALGNDFYFGTISGLCIAAVCTPTTELPPDPRYPAGTTVADVLKSIPEKSPGLLNKLYNQISYRLGKGSRAKVLVVEYGAPFPTPTGQVGPFCPKDGYMTSGELGVATDFTNALNKQLDIAANNHHFRIVKAGKLFRGLDVCGVTPAFFRPPRLPGSPPSGLADGTIHPNQLGQQLYAAAVGARLFF